ncbi:hypothetical protein MASR1M32_26040 [Rhodobacter sp.]
MTPIRRLAPLALGLCLALPQTASAEKLVIEGRAAQALHCATMFAIAGGIGHEAGFISDRDYEMIAFAAVRMMEHVPGTEAQKQQALRQRGDKLARTRTVEQLVNELDRTSDFCLNKFF